MIAKSLLYGIVGAVVTLSLYFSIGIPLYLFKGLKFIQSSPCQAVLTVWFLITLSIGIKISMRGIVR